MKSLWSGIRIFLLSGLLLLAVALAYFSLPTISYRANPSGKPLAWNAAWSDAQREQVSRWATKIAPNTDMLLILHQGGVIYERGPVNQLMNCPAMVEPIVQLVGKRMALGPDTHQVAQAGASKYSMAQLEKTSGRTAGQCLYQGLALPLHLQEFTPQNLQVLSLDPQRDYQLFVSTRDLAKIARELLKNTSPQKAWWEGSDKNVLWLDPGNELIVIGRTDLGNSLLSETWCQLFNPPNIKEEVLQLAKQISCSLP